MKHSDQYLGIIARTFKSEQCHTKFRLVGVLQCVYNQNVWHFYEMM
jgi:hypothetical protein